MCTLTLLTSFLIGAPFASQAETRLLTEYLISITPPAPAGMYYGAEGSAAAAAAVERTSNAGSTDTGSRRAP